MIFSSKYLLFLIGIVALFAQCNIASQSNQAKSEAEDVEQQFLTLAKQHLPYNADSINHVLYIGESQCATCYKFVAGGALKAIKDRIIAVMYTDTSRVRGFNHYFLDKDRIFATVPGIHNKSYLISYWRDSVICFKPIASIDSVLDVERRFYDQ